MTAACGCESCAVCGVALTFLTTLGKQCVAWKWVDGVPVADRLCYVCWMAVDAPVGSP